MHLCSKCNNKTAKGGFTTVGVFFCDSCLVHEEKYLFDNYTIDILGEIVQTLPFCIGAKTESDQRSWFIEYLHILYNRKVSPLAYRQAKNYVDNKGYSWLRMAQALEYYYLISKNPVVRSKGAIGIIPYVYEKAKVYYDLENLRRFNRAKTFSEEYKKKLLEPAKEVKVIEIGKTTFRKRDEVDLNSI